MNFRLNVKLEVRPRWWLAPYLNTLAFLCVLFGVEPDETKVRRVIARGLVPRVVPSDAA